MTSTELQSAVDGFKWYHEIDVGKGVKTKPVQRFDVSWDLIRDGIQNLDLTGKSILDIGTRDGKYAFQAERQGASKIVGIDTDQSQGALWLKERWKSVVEFRRESVYDVPLFPYDAVFFFGVLYHLRYPMQALSRVSKCLKNHGKLYIESGMLAGHGGMPLLYCPVRESPYEQTSCSFFNMEGLTETLWSFGCTVTSHRMHPDEDGKQVRRFWIEAEKTHDMPADLQRYWEGTHSSHSNHA